MSFAERLGSVVIAVATALAIIALVLPLFLNPIWVAFEQGRAESAAWTGFTEVDLRAATDAILADLVVGPPDFDVAIGGQPVLDERERSHMRDVRGVFIGFFVLAGLLAIAAIVIAWRRRGAARARSWRAVQMGAIVLAATLVAGGLVAFVAFDTMFEVFHRLLFAGGSYTFDPAADRLVQLFPFVFWQETAIAVGVVCVAVALLIAVVADGRSRRLESMAETDGSAEDDRAATATGMVVR